MKNLATNDLENQESEPVTAVPAQLEPLPDNTKLLHGHYTILECLGRTPGTIKYRARDNDNLIVTITECCPAHMCARQNNRLVGKTDALKDVFQEYLENFIARVRIFARARHSNIVGMLQLFRENQTIYMVTERPAGQSFQQIVGQKPKLILPDQVEELLFKALATISHLHKVDLLHGNLSPNAMSLDQMGNLIFDALSVEPDVATPGMDHKIGADFEAHPFTAPEITSQNKQLGPYTDFYALAATFYLLIADHPPVVGANRVAAISNNGQDPYKPLLGNFTGYEDGLLRSIDRALSIDPAARQQSADEWLDELDAIHRDPKPEPKSEAPANEVPEEPSVETIEVNAKATALDVSQAKPKPAQEPKPQVAAIRPGPQPATPSVEDIETSESEEILSIDQQLRQASMYGSAGRPSDEDVETPKRRLTPLIGLLAGVVIIGGAGLGGMLATNSGQQPASPASGGAPEKAISEQQVATESQPSESAVVVEAPVLVQPTPEPQTSEPSVVVEAPALVEPVTEATPAPQTQSAQILPSPSEQVEQVDVAAPLAPAIAPADPRPVETVSEDGMSRTAPPQKRPEQVSDAGDAADMIGESAMPQFAVAETVSPAATINVPLSASWSVNIPARLNETADFLVVADAMGSDFVNGDIIRLVNGQTIFSASDINEALLVDIDPQTTHHVLGLFGVDTPDGAVQRLVRMDVVRAIQLSDGTKLQSRRVNDVWETKVVATNNTDPSGLLEGDILKNNLATQELVNAPDSAFLIFQAAELARVESVSFAIERGGALRLATQSTMPFR